MDPGLLRDALTVVLGLAAGVLSGVFGLGGAVISTPGLRALGASAIVAVGTTLPSILPGAVAGTARYARSGLVDWRVVATAAPLGMGAAVLGSLASDAVPGDGHWLMVLTAALIALTAYRVSRPPTSPATDEVPAGLIAGDVADRRSPLATAAIGAAAGLLSGLLGVGGGTILVPAFSQVLRMPLRVTLATSLACVGLLAVPGTITHAALGHVDWRFALLLTVAVVPGARLGAAASLRLSDRRLRLVVAGFLGALSVVYAVSEVIAAL